MACAWLTELGAAEPDLPARLAGRVEPRSWRQVATLSATGLASPLTSSMGRLFDAVAALCGLWPEVSYEGQAAIALEAACDAGEHGRYALALEADADGLLRLDPEPALAGVLADLRAGVAVGRIAARFHAGVVEATVTACLELAARAGVGTVVLGGGVWANRRLSEDAATRLRAGGLRVLVPERLPPGDGAISFGQAAVAAGQEIRR